MVHPIPRDNGILSLGKETFGMREEFERIKRVERGRRRRERELLTVSKSNAKNKIEREGKGREGKSIENVEE